MEEEVRRLPGASAVSCVEGGVEFAGGLEVGMRANLWLRVATRVLLRVGVVRAREFAKLRLLLAKLPWERWVAEDPLRVQASASRCRLYHTGGLADALTLAVTDRLSGQGRAAPTLATAGAGREEAEAGTDAEEPAGPALETRVLLRGLRDEWTVSVDSSGELLHRRGWRTEAGKAPMRETLAAALLSLAGFDPRRPVLDPMCGSGTMALEAASRAASRAPGMGRKFAFQRWPGFLAERWRELLAEAERQRQSPPSHVFAWDRQAQAIERAERNAERAGLRDSISFARASFGEGTGTVDPPQVLDDLRARVAGTRGLVVINPPYGRRLGTTAQAARLVKSIGRTLRAQFPGWRAAVLLADPRWASALGLSAESLTPLSNGGLRLHLMIAEVPGSPSDDGAHGAHGAHGVRAKQ